MAVSGNADPAAWPAGRIQTRDPDLLRSMVGDRGRSIRVAEADARCEPLTVSGAASGPTIATATGCGSRHPGWHHRIGHPRSQAANRLLLP